VKLKIVVLVFASVVLAGCPVEENAFSCHEKIMTCEQESEMFCDKSPNGCGENCHYYVIESCWEECKDESR
jgi:hypothetical protein